MAQSMRIAHYNGTAPNAVQPDVVNIVGKLAQRINIRCIDGTNALEVSFDGKNFYRLPINSAPLDFTCALQRFYVRGVAGTSLWCAVTNEG